MNTSGRFALIIAVGFGACASFAQDLPYMADRTMYGITDGAGLIADVYVPTGEKNGLAVIDVISGAWYSDEGKVRDHKQAQVYNILCSRGYTVFGLWPGSRSRYTGEEMVAHLKRGVRWVKSQADAYEFDPDRLGLMGASAGGHLATLTAIAPEPANPDSDNDLMKFSTGVAAVAVFFPPTDFTEWAPGEEPDYERFADLFFGETLEGKSDDEVKAKATQLSPALQPIESPPPFLFIHGDADPMVPLSHSEKMVKAVQEAGGKAELVVKPGGAHPWPTINEEVAVLADWLDEHLTE